MEINLEFERQPKKAKSAAKATQVGPKSGVFHVPFEHVQEHSTLAGPPSPDQARDDT